ncbi:MAG: hypothetical protein ABIX37_03445 [Gammaproteobacteria bacterium]
MFLVGVQADMEDPFGKADAPPRLFTVNCSTRIPTPTAIASATAAMGDLNNNNFTDAQDTTLYRGLLGSPPGPSSIAP